ncbi:MAG: class I SAM-dependent methyltransferase [Desulfobacteraceae bacterium]
MKIIERDPGRVVEGFLHRIEKEAYSEPDSDLHMGLIDKILPEFARFIPDPQARLLDVGCGQGYASLKFKALGYQQITAIALNDEDVEASRNRGIDCYKMDMSFLGFEDKNFDALWVRHALEHSPFPYLTLLEFNRILALGGFIYIEMPMPDTPRVLENWPNHYSILGEQMWRALFHRSGFKERVKTRLQASLQIDTINAGLPFEEAYYAFVLEKTRDETIAL